MDTPVRWGFLGAGGIATNALAPAVQAADGAVLQAAAARDRDRAARLGPVGRAYGSYHEVLDDPDVDAVYIALANDAHVPWTLRAVAAGKPVLCEKPLGVSTAEVDEVRAAVDAHGGLVVEALWYRWHPRVRTAERLVREGAVGAVRHVAGGFVFAGVPADNYRMDPGKGGGALYDVGVYPVSAVLWAYGGLPVDVAATQRLAPSGVDLTTELVLSYPDGATAEVRASIDEPDRQWLTITGERGEIELSGQPYTSWHADSELLVSDGSGTERTGVPACDPYRLMVEEVSAVLRGREGWAMPLSYSRDVAAVLDAAFASARAGGEPVPLSPPSPAPG